MHSDPAGNLSGPRWRSKKGRRHSAWLAAGLALAACLLPAPAIAASYTWWATGSSGTQGGSGTWNTANAYWTTNGSAWVPWDNTTNAADTAVFSGTAGTVTLGTPITASRLTFGTTGYTVAGQTITLASGTPTITVSSGTAMISSILAGTAGLRKMGSGTLTLSAANTYTGTTTIDNGMLRIGAGGTTGSLNTGIIRLTGSGNIAFNRSDNLTFTNSIFSLTGNGIGGFVTHSGTGTLDLTQAARVHGINTAANAGAMTISGELEGWSRTTWRPLPFVFRPAAGTTIAVTGTFATDLTYAGIQVSTVSGGTAGTVFLGTATRFFNGPFFKVITAGALDIVGGKSELLAGNVGFTVLGENGGGGVLQLSGTLTSSLGTGTGQIFWDSWHGGFAARTAPAVINIGGSREQLTWGSTYFLNYSNHLIFGSNTADNVVTFENPIDLATYYMNVRVVDNPDSSGDSAVLAGVLSNGGLNKAGTGLLTLTANNTYVSDTYISSGTLRIGAGGTTGSIVSRVSNGATLAFNRSNDLTYSGSVSGTGRLLKQGAGNLVLDGTSTYTGATIVEAGRLSVDGLLFSSPVTVLSAAELGGSGVIVRPVSVSSGGTLSPGNSIASLSTGTATFAAGAIFEYEVDSSNLAALDTAADLLVVNGSLNLDPGNGTVISFTDLAGSPNPFVNDTTLFALINYSGTWNGGLFTYNGTVLADGDRFFVGSQEWEIDYNRSSSAGLDNFTAEYLPSSRFVTVMAVPEPSTIAMALAGLACGGFSMWRRRTRP
jgi:fibronectin-binding autotransporter adhesin